MLFSYGYGQQQNRGLQKMQANLQGFQSPCCRGNTAQCASSNEAYPWLHAKLLDAAIKRVPTPYCPGSCYGWRFQMKPKNTNKTQLLPSFLTVDRCKKAKQFWDTKWILYSSHQCNKLHTNKKPQYSSWIAQLHFELSNVVNGQKSKTLLALNKAQENLWARYGPIANKLLRLPQKMLPRGSPHGPISNLVLISCYLANCSKLCFLPLCHALWPLPPWIKIRHKNHAEKNLVIENILLSWSGRSCKM